MSSKYMIGRKREYDFSPVYFNGISRTSPENLDLYGAVIKKMWLVFYRGKCISVFNKNETEIIGKKISNKLIKTNFLSDMIKENKHRSQALINKCQEYHKTDMNKNQLIPALKDLINKFIGFDNSNLYLWFLAAQPFKDYLCDKLKNIPKNKVDLLLQCPDTSFKTKENREILKITVRNQKESSDPTKKEITEGLIQKYFWSNFGYDGKSGVNSLGYYQKINFLWENRLSPQ